MTESMSQIDDSLYSRQRYVLGDAAMERMAASRILVCGLDGLGIEAAKNLALAGVRELALQDPTICTAEDLGEQFFVTADDISASRRRDEASAARLRELNPYVSVQLHHGNVASPDDALDYIGEFNCVILIGASAAVQCRVSAACRARRVPLVCSAVHGLLGCLFNDYGDDFLVQEPTADEPREEFVSSVTAADCCVCTLDGRPHRLCVGDLVTFREVRGAERLNSGRWRVSATPAHDAFCIEASQQDLAGYQCGGIFVQCPQPVRLHFRRLEHFLDGGLNAEGLSQSLVTPDLGKDWAPLQLHCLHLALLRLTAGVGADALAAEARALISSAPSSPPQPPMDAEFVSRLARTATAGGRLQPMCALFGGLAAQEVLKAITAKFTPFCQWLYLDAVELFDDRQPDPATAPLTVAPRYKRLAACIGAEAVDRMRNLRLFLVGCGAIGCELLKNFALCGFCTSGEGRLTATDDDAIEKSNLNRQFLFRPSHIRQSKALVAAEAARRMNPDISIEGLQLRVGPETELTAFTDKFIFRQDACVNALDNVAARRYMDQRCVANQRPLFESGTMGARGHVQVVLPFVTESYSAQQDPTDEEQVPYCTLKTFPQRIEHCIEWARDKFESSFACKPALVARLLDAHGNSVGAIAQRLADDQVVQDAADAFRYLRQRPSDWPDCIQLAARKFAKYFHHRALHVLRAFPPETRLPDGSSFWAPPKRPPRPIVLEPGNPLHVSCVLSIARLYASAFSVPLPQGGDTLGAVAAILQGVTLPEYVPSNKTIETDESKKRAEVEASVSETADQPALLALFSSLSEPLLCRPVRFDKDDDSHVDAMAALANLRAAMYGLDMADRLRVKRIAGRIVPAIATTTAAVAGLVAIEMLKHVRLRRAGQLEAAADQETQLTVYRNCFLNLAVPLLVLSQPGPCKRNPLPGGRHFTEWDRWEVGPVDRAVTIGQLTNLVQQSCGLTPSMVCQGSKSVYIPMLPGHRKRIQQPLLSYARLNPGDSYVDLIVMYEPDAADQSGDEAETDIVGPVVRVHFSTTDE